MLDSFWLSTSTLHEKYNDMQIVYNHTLARCCSAGKRGSEASDFTCSSYATPRSSFATVEGSPPSAKAGTVVTSSRASKRRSVSQSESMLVDAVRLSYLCHFVLQGTIPCLSYELVCPLWWYTSHASTQACIRLTTPQLHRGIVIISLSMLPGRALRPRRRHSPPLRVRPTPRTTRRASCATTAPVPPSTASRVVTRTSTASASRSSALQRP